MKNKSVFWLLIVGLLILVPALAACGRTTESGDLVFNIPHDTDWGFENCLACHAGGLYAMPDDGSHDGRTTDLCPTCHFPAIKTQTKVTLPTTTPPTTTPPTTTPPTTTPPTTTVTEGPGPISYDNHFIYTDASSCFVCHTGAGAVKANPEDHADYANDSCFDAGCHEPAVAD